MAAVKSVIDFCYNAVLNTFNALRTGMGIFFVVWLVKVFVFPHLKKLFSSLRG